MVKISGYVVREDHNFGDFDYYAKDELPEVIIEELHKLNIPEVYFYGSRSKMYIPVEDQVSDWDFAFQNIEASVTNLLQNGFKLKDTDDYPYADNFSFQVFEKQVGDYKIQMCSKGDLEMFKDVWDGISSKFWKTYINKRSPNYIGKEGVTALMCEFKYMIDCAISKPLEDML